MDQSDKRAWAIKSLRETLTRLEANRKNFPSLGTLVPRIHADNFNASIEALGNELGPDVWSSYLIAEWQIRPASKSQDRPVDGVSRESVISSIKTVFRVLNIEDHD